MDAERAVAEPTGDAPKDFIPLSNAELAQLEITAEGYEWTAEMSERFGTAEIFREKAQLVRRAVAELRQWREGQ